jgi:phospholipase/carboxylesterase
MRGSADSIGAILIAPDSIGRTWDVIAGAIGPDVERIDAQLAMVFDAFAIEVDRICASGFSDGASYALTLGILNGDLFSHVIAFSPGFLAARSHTGAPRIFISHGTRDEILPSIAAAAVSPPASNARVLRDVSRVRWRPPCRVRLPKKR